MEQGLKWKGGMKWLKERVEVGVKRRISNTVAMTCM